MLLNSSIKISLHSIMFLLIQNPEVNSSYYFTYFTFHNVSINTENPDVSGVDFQNFTFHDVSINTLSSTHSKSRVVPLHSTMLLLIQIIRCMKLMLIASLHSTMFLLIRCIETIYFVVFYEFEQICSNVQFIPSPIGRHWKSLYFA